ncbi:MAG: hypothetical protein AAF439_13090 [Pseudomonadota bacterium]
MKKVLLALAIALLATLAAPTMDGFKSPAVSQFAAGAAEAAGKRRETRRQVRRTIRRIDRRQDRRDYRRATLPASCIQLIINGFPHWRCGSLYYREVVKNGVTVYIVVEL